MTNVLTLPSRGAQRPGVAPEIAVCARPLWLCANWQAAIAGECRRLRTLNPSLIAFLKTSGLLSRCTFLATEEPGGPLIFQYIGRPTLAKLGRAWGRTMLGQPMEESPHAEFAHSVEAQYGAAIESGELMLNRIDVRGIGAPFAYSHLLVGWADRGRRAILSAIELGA